MKRCAHLPLMCQRSTKGILRELTVVGANEALSLGAAWVWNRSTFFQDSVLSCRSRSCPRALPSTALSTARATGQAGVAGRTGWGTIKWPLMLSGPLANGAGGALVPASRLICTGIRQGVCQPFWWLLRVGQPPGETKKSPEFHGHIPAGIP